MGAVCEFLVYPAGGDRAHINLVSYVHNIWGNVCSSNHFQWCIQIFVNFVFADSYTDFLDNFRTLLSLAKLGFVYLFRFFFRYPLHTIFYLWLVFEMPSWNGISRGEFLSIGKKKTSQREFLELPEGFTQLNIITLVVDWEMEMHTNLVALSFLGGAMHNA